MSNPSHHATTLAALLRQQAQDCHDHVALMAPGCQALSYGRLWAEVQQAGQVLRAAGVTQSTRVALCLPQGPQAACAFLAVASHAVCAPLNPASREAELRDQLESLGARAVVVDSVAGGPIREVAAAMQLQVLEVALADSGEAGLLGLRLASDRPRARSATVHETADQPQDVALVLHTSGTTSRPKRVPLSHANLLASARAIAHGLDLSVADRGLIVMPLFHIHGLVGALLAPLTAGGSVVCTSGFDPRRFFDWVAAFQPTWYTAVPTIHQAVLAQGAAYRQLAPGHRLRFVRSSSAQLATRTWHELEALLQAPVIQAYGMTEAASLIASNPLVGARKPGTVGQPCGLDLALMDPEGRLLPVGETGEVVIRGPGVTAGYEDRPDANAEAFTQGWFRTGDLGRIDGDGCLILVGRLKEMINRGGEKVSPPEVDEALMAHPDVVRAVAFAVPHASLGEDLAAAVVLREGAAADEQVLRHHLLQRLAAFKVPSVLVLVDAIPVGASGKVQRRLLHEQLAPHLHKGFVEPASPIEKAAADTIRTVLACGPVGLHDNFFGLGGDSITGARVMARLNEQRGLQLAVSQLFVHPTVATLAGAIESALEDLEHLRQQLADQIEQLSDDEVERLLAEAP
jgi:oxalate---CoA ligase